MPEARLPRTPLLESPMNRGTSPPSSFNRDSKLAPVSAGNHEPPLVGSHTRLLERAHSLQKWAQSLHLEVVIKRLSLNGQQGQKQFLELLFTHCASSL